MSRRLPCVIKARSQTYIYVQGWPPKTIWLCWLSKCRASKRGSPLFQQFLYRHLSHICQGRRMSLRLIDADHVSEGGMLPFDFSGCAERRCSLPTNLSCSLRKRLKAATCKDPGVCIPRVSLIAKSTLWHLVHCSFLLSYSILICIMQQAQQLTADFTAWVLLTCRKLKTCEEKESEWGRWWQEWEGSSHQEAEDKAKCLRPNCWWECYHSSCYNSNLCCIEKMRNIIFPIKKWPCRPQ